MVDAVFGDQGLHGFAHVFGVDSIELQTSGRFLGAEFRQLHGLGVLFDQGAGGDHFADVEPGAELPADRTERVVGDSRHGSQDHGDIQAKGSDRHRGEFSGGSGFDSLIDLTGVACVHGLH